MFVAARQLRTLVDTKSKLTSSFEILIMTCEQSYRSMCTHRVRRKPRGEPYWFRNKNFKVMPLNLNDDYWRAVCNNFKKKKLILEPINAGPKRSNDIKARFKKLLQRRNTFTSYPVDVSCWSVANNLDYCRQDCTAIHFLGQTIFHTRLLSVYVLLLMGVARFLLFCSC